MPRQRSVEDYSSDELRQLLVEKRRSERESRLEAYRKTGRVIPVELEQPKEPSTAQENLLEVDTNATLRQRVRARRKTGMDRFLIAVEILAIVGLFFIIFSGVNVLRNLNTEFASALNQPDLTPTALITAVVLPGGHTAPVEGAEVRPNEAEIPEHLRPLMQSYANLPIPTQGPQQARQIQIPAIGVNAPVVLGDGWEQLKKGVGQHLGTANPGEIGNLVVSAHNDIFGELFKNLDQLQPGDEVVIITQDSTFTYQVTGTQIVEPTRVDLMAPGTEKTLTLISCYPYRVDTQRIVVTAVLQQN
ncbi:MAG: class D sortase [Chloroflexi bacterium]|nr:class D sortase [Chloroflexota bacterium]